MPADATRSVRWFRRNRPRFPTAARRGAIAAIVSAFFLAACAPAIVRAFADQPGAVVDAHAAYPEGPLWRQGRLYVAEMGADRVSVFAGAQKDVYWTRDGCGPTSLAPYGEGLVVLCHLSARLVVLDAQGRAVRAIDQDDQGRRFRDPNDSSADGRGGVYFSDPGPFSRDAEPQGAIIHLSADGTVQRVLDGLWYPNGVLADGDRRLLYVSETFRHRVLRYAIGENGALRETGAFDVEREAPARPADIPVYREWGPDGLEFAPNGDVLVAIYGHGRILRISPDLRYLGQARLPTRFSTNLVFGDNGEVYTTGAFDNLERPFPGEVRRWTGEGFASR
jgi:gluconolactonase